MSSACLSLIHGNINIFHYWKSLNCSWTLLDSACLTYEILRALLVQSKFIMIVRMKS